jgi:hypothetical protein
VSLLLSYILRDVSFSEVHNVFRVAFREPIHLCTCVNEERTDGESPRSETPSQLSYTLRYVSFAEVGSICRVALRVSVQVVLFIMNPVCIFTQTLQKKKECRSGNEQ